jgi:hypothetical protein
MCKFWSTLALLMLTATLAACGGSDNAAFVKPGGGSSSSGGSGSSAPGGTTVTAADLVVTTSTATIPADGSASATITALAKNDNNNLIAGVNVCFSASSGGIAVTGGTNGCVTTGANGAAAATLSTAGDASLRTITVTATSGTQTATGTVQVVAAGGSTTTTVQMGNGSGMAFVAGQIGVGVGAAQLAAGGSTGLAVSVVDQSNNLYTAVPVTVTFNSPCAANGQATITATGGSGASATTTSGIVNANYVAKGCSGSDTITASATVSGQNLAATGTVTIAAATIGSIQFVSASTTTIGLKGTGLNQTSTLIFKVVDATGGPYSGVTVSFTPNTTVGGLSISPATAKSATDGTVQTTVSAGTVHTAVRVTASITSPAALSTQSSQLTVTTGLPTSNGFSIAVGKATYGNGTSTLACPNTETNSIDGVTTPITVFLSDRYSNPVPDGTAVAFTTDGGQIVGNCNTGPPLASGSCVVTWTSADPRPGPTSPTSTTPAIVKGRAMILATAIGEESFDDINGSGFYVAGDSFANLGEPYRDDNEDGAYESGEYFLDFNNNGMRDAPTGSFIGITCTGTTPASTCTQNTLAIGTSLQLTMATSAAHITFVSGTAGVTNGGSATAPSLSVPSSGGSVAFNVQDLNGNSMAAGTGVTITLSSTVTGETFSQIGPTTVGCDAGQGGQDYSVSLSAGAIGPGTLTVTVTSPSGTVTYLLVPVTFT